MSVTCVENRLLELLWFVGYCIEFPTMLATRIDGHEDWNRHVMYRAIREGYVTLYRKQVNRHVLRSLSITEKGLEYVAERDPEALALILARRSQSPQIYPSRVDKIQRLHALAIGLVMAYQAGAEIRADRKPSLRISPDTRQQVEPNHAYYYTASEIRSAITEYAPKTVLKSSRIIGVLTQGKRFYCLYYTGRTRMYWARTQEENHVAGIQTLLTSRGFPEMTPSQVVIGTSMPVVKRIARSENGYQRSHYFVVSGFFSKCFFLTNNAEGDRLLRLIIDPSLRLPFEKRLLEGYCQPHHPTREYDAIEGATLRPVKLAYTCDLRRLTSNMLQPLDNPRKPILLCMDYQTQVLQELVGGDAEIRPINGG